MNPQLPVRRTFPVNRQLAGFALMLAQSMAVTMRKWQPVPVSAPKPFLTLREASQYSGLSVALLERLIQMKKLKSFWDGVVKVSRCDLDRLDVTKLKSATVQLKRVLKARRAK